MAKIGKDMEKIGFIGAGNMAFAIASGLISKGIVKPSQIIASKASPTWERWTSIGVAVTLNNCEVYEASKIIFICVKPHILNKCASDLHCSHDTLTERIIVSVLAGVSLETLVSQFENLPVQIVRAMPNTSVQIGQGVTVYSPHARVTQENLEKVSLLLSALGMAKLVPESLIDPATGLMGCGPAYVYTMVEALADGAVKQGIPRKDAIEMAAQTVLGASQTILMTGKHPAILRDEVCSPGGATIHGVHELEKGNLRATLINAVEMSSKRATELGKK